VGYSDEEAFGEVPGEIPDVGLFFSILSATSLGGEALAQKLEAYASGGSSVRIDFGIARVWYFPYPDIVWTSVYIP
jgi:hypothetical protein